MIHVFLIVVYPELGENVVSEVVEKVETGAEVKGRLCEFDSQLFSRGNAGMSEHPDCYCAEGALWYLN